ncbi:MAG: YjzC family protein [Anaerolineaceae bacterium]|nr:YjzC family protein [Anaerolineaceae bacterium]
MYHKSKSGKQEDLVYKTGSIALYTGNYEFVEYVDGTTWPAPTWNERKIPLDRGDVFPPVKSTNKAAWWRYIG